MKKKSIYLQMFNGLRLMVLLPVSILFFITSFVFLFYYTNSRVNASDIQMSNIENRLEHYFTSANHYSRLLLNNDVIQRSFNTYYTDTDDFSAQKINMSLEIYKLIYPAPYIFGISIYDKDYNIIVSSERKPYPGDFKSVNVTGGKWLATQKYDNSSDSLINTFSYIHPIYDYRSGDLYGYVELIISEKSLSDIYVSDTSNSLYLLLDENYHVISKSKSSDKNSTLVTKIINVIKSGKSGHILKDYGFINTMPLKTYPWRLVHFIPLFLFIRPALTTAFVFLITALLSLLLALIKSKDIAKNLSKPIYALVEHTHYVSSGQWREFSYTANSPEVQTLISNFNVMIRSQNELKNKLLDTQKEKNALEIDKVNEQIKPHFLYNTLDNIYSLASLDEKDTLMELVMNLSKFYRGSLSLGKNFVSLKEELDTCRAYLDIMAIRYHGKFDYKIYCKKDLENFKCPKLILQPLVENCIYHGIKGLKYKGKILIEVQQSDNDIIFNISDNGFGIDIAKVESILADKLECNNHFALKHINRILTLYYGHNYRLEFRNKNIGCTISFKIKKEEYDKTCYCG